MRRTAVVFACSLLSVLCLAAQTAQQPEKNDSGLAKRVTVLEQQQQQILRQLKLLDAKIRPPAVPPTSFKVQSEPFIGERDAPVAVVEFADFECQYCGQFARDTYPQVLENYVKTGAEEWGGTSMSSAARTRVSMVQRWLTGKTR